MRVVRALVCMSVAVALVATATPEVDAVDGTTPSFASSTSSGFGEVGSGLTPKAKAQGKAQGKPKGGIKLDHYVVPIGVKFNNPYGNKDSERNIFRHIVRTINSVKRGQEIHIASWNIRSGGMADALIAAHRRGVTVRLVMDRSNATDGNPNRDVRRIVGEFRGKQNMNRKASRRSFLRKCISSCRAPSGIAHTKFYLFSRVGKQKNVVMYGSNNATDLAATIQWNDLFTMKGRQDIYDDFNHIFYQMSKDKRVKGPAYQSYTFSDTLSIGFYPYKGATAVGDPAMTQLNNIQCKGATGGAGYKGHTVIRIAQTAQYGDRGIALAKRLATMSRRGCYIRLVYAMFGNEVLRILRAGGVKLTHLAYDADDDGIYDRYVHMKTMAVSGVYQGKTNSWVTFNGSANWTPVALSSDEVTGTIKRRAVTTKYLNWIDYMFTHRPASWGADSGGGSAAARMQTLPRAQAMKAADARVLERAAERGVDPYSLIKSQM